MDGEIDRRKEDGRQEADALLDLKKKCALFTCNNIKDLKACSACNEVFYCCREHQVEHFKEGGHKFVCPGRIRGERGKPPLTFAECNEKAGNYYSQRMWLAALPYYAAMLELTERTLNVFHPQVGNLLHVIMECYKGHSKIDKAILCLQRMILIREVNNDGSSEKNKGTNELKFETHFAYANRGVNDHCSQYRSFYMHGPSRAVVRSVGAPRIIA